MMVEIENVWKRFGRFEALEGMTFAVPEGSTFALIGPNGAGKSTTIKIVMNLIKASHGTVRVLDIDSRKLSAREFAQIGYVAENQELPPRITVALSMRRGIEIWKLRFWHSLIYRLTARLAICLMGCG